MKIDYNWIDDHLKIIVRMFESDHKTGFKEMFQKADESKWEENSIYYKDEIVNFCFLSYCWGASRGFQTGLRFADKIKAAELKFKNDIKKVDQLILNGMNEDDAWNKIFN